MKRVRYLAGAAGLAPMVLGALAGGGAHAAADVTGHGETVAPRAAGITGHGKAVAPYARAHLAGPIPNIRRESCLTEPWNSWVEVGQSHNGNVDCFGQGGHENVKIYHIDYVYTGNNRVFFVLKYNGTSYLCNDGTKGTTIHASSCGVPNNAGTMTFISIY